MTCECGERTTSLPPIGTINDIIEKMRRAYNIKPGSTEWPEEAQEMVLKLIRQMFRNTAFNTCTTQKLPTMNVKEMTISIKSENARPTNVIAP